MMFYGYFYVVEVFFYWCHGHHTVHMGADDESVLVIKTSGISNTLLESDLGHYTLHGFVPFMASLF